jgi:hypothetical protein
MKAEAEAFAAEVAAAEARRKAAEEQALAEQKEAAAAEARQRAAEEQALAEQAAEARRRAAEEQALAEQKERARTKMRDQTHERLRALLSRASLSEAESKSVLRSCAQACAANDIDFVALLQEPIFAGDLPVYWAIVKSRAASASATQRRRGRRDADALILTILDFSRPLQSATIVAARRGCMAVSDNILFRRLCGLFKEFAPGPVSDTDMMLLEGSGAQDNVVVEELSGNDGAFVARIEVAQFRLRMRVSGRVCVEFVARGKRGCLSPCSRRISSLLSRPDRIWCLTFAADTCLADTFPAEKPGAFKSGSSSVDKPWVFTLGLGEHSLPTCVDGQLVITGNSAANSPVPTESEQSFSPISIPLGPLRQELQPGLIQLVKAFDKSVTGTDLPDGCVF